jgi:hypothetical protein
LAPDGASISYSCDVTNVTDGFINSATVTGTPPVGEDVTDTDEAKVRLDETQACPTDMLAYWNLDETSSGAYDDFYYGHDGQCSGQCPTPTTAGRVNGGQVFDGSNTGIDVPVVPGDESFNWGMNDSFSIEFWMQADSASTCSGNEVIVGRDDASPTSSLHWWVGCRDGGRAAFRLGKVSGTTALVRGSTDLTNGAWHHVVAVRDASTNVNRIYVDGAEEDSTTVTYTDGFDSPTAALNIGYLSGGSHFEGTVDEVALYNRVLSADEIRQYYNNSEAYSGYCISPDITVNKTANPTVISSGDTVTYTYIVNNAGDASMWGISLSDDKCSPVTPVGSGYNVLDSGEVLTYTCSTTLNTDTTNTATVTATVTGTHSLGVTISVSNTDTALVSVTDLPSNRIFLPIILKGF